MSHELYPSLFGVAFLKDVVSFSQNSHPEHQSQNAQDIWELYLAPRAERALFPNANVFLDIEEMIKTNCHGNVFASVVSYIEGLVGPKISDEPQV